VTSGQGVALVVVSHSRALADAAVALASEMLHNRPVNIEVAAGLDDTTFGTDAVRIKEAIERVDGPDGVVVLMDLGSAVLSTELALDLLADPSARDRVILSPAPIVEGLIVAAVAAAGGATRLEVAAEASGALMGKAAHLSVPVETLQTVSEDAPAGEVVAIFSIANQHGLHARPAARLVSEVHGLDASIQLRNLTTGAGPVPASSLSRVATLGALRDHQIEVRASGPQAHEAVDHLLDLARRRFGEPDEPAGIPVPPAGIPMPSTSSPLTGPLPASPGIAIGPVRKLTATPLESDKDAIGDPTSEWRRIVESVAQVSREIEHVRLLTAREVGPDEASIFDAHLALLADAEMLNDVKARIGAGAGAPAAWAACLADVQRQWARLPDPYLSQRAEDVEAVARQVLRALTGVTSWQALAEGVLVARDLTPADAAGLDPTLVSGVVLAYGSPSSHAAILARARNIPLVVAAGREVLNVPEGTRIIIDGGSGELHIDPAPDVLEQFQRRASELAERRARDLARAQEPTVSRDGVSFAVAANLASVADARSALAAGADGAGLVRTEFLFLDRSTAPDEAEQEAEYAAIAEAMGGRRITLRTLDVGGDKPLPYLPMPFEQNPFLGLRGIRLSLDRRDLLREQLVAVCRTARSSPVSVMFPMVSTIGELLEAKKVLSEAAGSSGLPPDLRLGMMVEVPAAALKIESFLPHLDFVSIGTNDLTQYTLAAERGNAAVASVSDALDPGVLQLIHRVCQAAHGRVDVAVCGEAASDELAIPVLVGLGVRELSVALYAVPHVKESLRELDVERCGTMAAEALTLASPDEVRKLVLAMLSATSGELLPTTVDLPQYRDVPNLPLSPMR
jgi:phosphoenolpyruvate-protein phosphotransferase/dihydroxyacetone kinase phosphotransfer subunit